IRDRNGDCPLVFLCFRARGFEDSRSFYNGQYGFALHVGVIKSGFQSEALPPAHAGDRDTLRGEPG
ncbi:hypothetical protein QMO17_36405, partial [Klebsiella pneumoniae]|nr:hypothetical protein [Klebsiella pneumoniae]